MTDHATIVQEYTDAFDSKDIDRLAAILHEDFTFTGPIMSFGNKAEMLEFTGQCPFTCKSENVTIAVDGKRAFKLFDWTTSEPVQVRIRMCEACVIEDGKLLSVELLFDTAQFPDGFRERLQARWGS